MVETCTLAVAGTEELAAEDTRSGDWIVESDVAAGRRFRPVHGVLSYGLLAGLAMLSPMSVVDPVLTDRRRETQPTLAVFGVRHRKRISLQEAHRGAVEAMKRIEAARLHAAEDEARRAFDLWDIA